MTEQTYYQQLAAAVGAGESDLISKIFEDLIDDREAKVLLAAAPPATGRASKMVTSCPFPAR